MSTRAKKRRLYWEQAQRFAPFVAGWTGEDPLLLCPLCLTLWDRASVNEKTDAVTVEHAPARQAGSEGVERCLTCGSCNLGAGGTFETATADLNSRRREAIAQAPVTFAQALDLATVRHDERRAELKSAYLIAFAALGHSYVLDAALDQVRRLIAEDGEAPDLRTCALMQGSEELPARSVLVAHAPLHCILVTHPTGHHPTDSGHVVLLPVPGSDGDFYEHLGDTTRSASGDWLVEDPIPWPEARSLPMAWDRDETVERRAQVSLEAVYGCDDPAHDDHVLTIRTVDSDGRPVVATLPDHPTCSS